MVACRTLCLTLTAETADHFFGAAGFWKKNDSIVGVSESIIVDNAAAECGTSIIFLSPPYICYKENLYGLCVQNIVLITWAMLNIKIAMTNLELISSEYDAEVQRFVDDSTSQTRYQIIINQSDANDKGPKVPFEA
ncbi:hypothetical protein BDR04DRAFT_1122589 [Suillus decipiens]|nr:hypothetical protein BDR04DRAFT_1122589 [Suillus decipiens]